LAVILNFDHAQVDYDITPAWRPATPRCTTSPRY